MAGKNQKPRSPRRRAFLTGSVAAVGTLGTVGSIEAQEKRASGAAPSGPSPRPYNGPYEGETLSRVAFPLGGMGAGMLCLEGTGALSHVSLRHQPNVFNEPCVFAAVCVKGEPNLARVVEGPVPTWKRFGLKDSGNGSGGATWGLPRFARARFRARFPFGTVALEDDDVPLKVEITGWSPFEAGDPDSSSLPFVALEYRLTNPTARALTGVFSWNARNLMAVEKGEKAVRAIPGGFVLWGGGAKETPWDDGSFCVRTTDPEARVNHAWFRGGWFDDLTLAWKDVEEGACYDRPPVTEGPPSPGATVFVPFSLAPGAAKTIVVQLSWYVGESHLRVGDDPEDDEPAGERRYRPWYAKRFSGIEEAAESWRSALRRAAREDRPLLGLLPRPDPAARGGRGGGRQPDDPQVPDGDAPGGRAPVELGGLRRQLGLLPRVLHARLELRAGGAAPLPVAGADAARDGVPRLAGRARAPDLPRRAAHPAPRPRLPRRGRRAARRHPEGLPGVAHLRRHGVAAQPVAEREDEPRLLHRHVGPAPHRGPRGAPPQHVRHRVLGPGRDVHELLPRRAPGGDAHGPGARRPGAGLRGAPREGPAPHGDGPLERRVLRPEGAVEGPAGREPPGHEEHGRRVLAGGPRAAGQGRTQVPVRGGLPLRRRPRRVDGRGVRGRRGPRPRQDRRATCARSTATT